MLLNATIGLSFQRMFLTGRVTLPFSIRNKPVARQPGHQHRLRIERPDVPEPRHEHAALGTAIRSAMVALPPSMIRFAGPAVGSLALFCAQNRE